MEKDNNTKIIDAFFEYDLRVKKLLNDIIPKQDDFYDEDSKTKYADKVVLDLKKMELYMDRMFLLYNIPKDIIVLFEEKIGKLNEDVGSEKFYMLLNEGCSNTLKYVHDNITDMRVEFVDSIQKGFIGYYIFFGKDVLSPITINEFLHYIHSYVINDEKFYSKVNIVRTTKKDKDDWKGITLRGKSNDLGNELYENIIDSEVNSACIDIINLDKKVLIMARDLGHAAVIEADLEKEDIFVRYHFPKNNNMEMTSKLKGINVNRDEFAIGNFQTTREDFVRDVCSLMKGIPTDFDRVNKRVHF